MQVRPIRSPASAASSTPHALQPPTTRPRVHTRSATAAPPPASSRLDRIPAAQRQALQQRAATLQAQQRQLLAQAPSYAKESRAYMKAFVQQHFHQDLDPDHVYLNEYRPPGNIVDGPRTLPRKDRGKFVNSRSLSQVAIDNVTNPLGTGFARGDRRYRIAFGHDPRAHYEDQHDVIDPAAFYKSLGQMDFLGHYRSRVDAYYKDNAAALRQVRRDIARFEVDTQHAIGDIQNTTHALALRGIDGDQDGRTAVYPVDVCGYTANDSLRIEDRATGANLLYLSGDPQPVQSFVNRQQAVDWLKAKSGQFGWTRQFANAHFSANDAHGRTGGLGVKRYLDDEQSHRDRSMHSFSWDTGGHGDHYLESRRNIAPDPFGQLAEIARRGQLEDAAYDITTNSDANRETWRRGLAALPLPLVSSVPGLFLSKTPAQRDDSARQVVLDLLTLGLPEGAAEKPFARALGKKAEEAAAAQAARTAQRIAAHEVESAAETSAHNSLLDRLMQNQRFNVRPPQRINGRLGYAMGPTRPPKWRGSGEDEPPPRSPAASSVPSSRSASPGSAADPFPLEARDLEGMDSDGLEDILFSDPNSGELKIHSPDPAAPASPSTPEEGPAAGSAEHTASPTGTAIATPPIEAGHQPVTSDHLDEWARMSQAERDRIGFDVSARAHRLHPMTWRNLVAKDGSARSQGLALIQKDELGRYQPVTAERMREWQDMSQQERDRIGLDNYALTRQMSPTRWRQHIFMDGRPTARGQELLDRAGGKTFRPVTAEHVREWEHLSQQERDQAWAGDYAQRHGLSLVEWRDTVRKDGRPRVRGQSLLDKSAAVSYRQVAPTDLLNWQHLSQQERDKIGIAGYAKAHHLNPYNWRNTVSQTGSLSARGEALMRKAAGQRYQPITADHVDQWRRMSQQERSRIGILGYAAREDLNPNTWSRLVRKDGSLGIDKRRPLQQSSAGKRKKTPQPQPSVPASAAPASATHPSPVAAATGRLATDDDLLRWQNLTRAQRGAIGGVEGYAQARRLNLASWRRLVDAHGALTAEGAALLYRPGPSRKP